MNTFCEQGKVRKPFDGGCSLALRSEPSRFRDPGAYPLLPGETFCNQPDRLVYARRRAKVDPGDSKFSLLPRAEGYQVPDHLIRADFCQFPVIPGPRAAWNPESTRLHGVPGKKVDIFAPSWCAPPDQVRGRLFGPSAAPLFPFGSPASVSGSPLRDVRDDDVQALGFLRTVVGAGRDDEYVVSRTLQRPEVLSESTETTRSGHTGLLSCRQDRRPATSQVVRALFCALLCLLFAASGTVVAANVELPRNLQQGQLVIGHTTPDTQVTYDGRELRVGDDGTFVFGLGRNAPETIELELRGIDGQTTQLSRKVQQRSYKIERVNGLPQQTVTPRPKIAARIAREQGLVGKARQRDDAREDFLAGFRRPVKSGRISGVYGSQRIDNGVPKSPHYGLDMAVPTGTPVHAPAAGIVSFAADHLYLTGGTVLIDHGFGLDSSYLHMSKVDVKVGQKVKQGDLIGAVGMSGRATGPHLHWGFNWFGVRLDPALLPKPTQERERQGASD